jgi:pimeloyl-ACP methyl ester carboxylesterase
MSGKDPAPVSVRGGSDGIEAHYDDMTTLARLFGNAATDVAGAALSMHGYLLDPGLYSSGLLDPRGAAEFSERLVAALDGPHGLATVAARCAAHDAQLRAAAMAYQSADRLHSRVATDVGALRHAPGALLDAGVTLLGTFSVGQSFGALMAADPELGGVLMQGALPFVWPAELFLPDGHAAVRATGVDLGADLDGPPRALADIISGLARRDATRHGEIDVRRMTGADGRTYVLVDIPGSKSWSPSPVNHDVTSLASNLRALEGQPTTYEQGVVQAMRSAGVQPSDSVMLVGHSLGGMVAVKTATDLAHTGEFHVTNVVTAGAPIGTSAGQVPPSVQVLALENSGDVVPQLDARPNPDRVNVTTVTVHHNHGDPGANHDLTESYVPGARDIDASTNPSVQTFMAGIGGFLGATEISTSTYIVTRTY